MLYDARWRAIDASGNPLVGATLTIYVANTTTPVAIFHDVALSDPMTNPTSGTDVSDAGGWFPQIFAGQGSNVDITLRDSAGVVVKTYVDVPFLGSDSGDFERTVTGDGRVTITGSAGNVLMQVGSPSPDNVGGNLVIEGYAGTQGDLLTLDFATVDVLGDLTEGGKKIQGVVATPATTLAAATSLIIPLPNDPAGCRAWRVDFFDMSRSAATIISLTAQFSFDGGSTYKSTNEYDYVVQGYGQGSSGPSTSPVNDQSAAVLAFDIAGGSNRLMWGTIEILSPLSGTSSDATIIRSHVTGWNQATPSIVVHNMATAFCQSAGQGRPTHLKLLANSGNIDCKYRVVPMRGFGE